MAVDLDVVAKTICEALYPGVPSDIVGWDDKFSDEAKAIWHRAVAAGIEKYEQLRRN